MAKKANQTSIVKENSHLIDAIALEGLRLSTAKKLKSKRVRKERKHELLNQTLNENLQWKASAHEAQLLQSHLYLWKQGMKTLEVEDWESGGAKRLIVLSPPLSAGDEIKKRMTKSRKQQRSIPHLEREIQLNLQSLEQLSQIENQLEAAINSDQILAIRQKFRLDLPTDSSAREKKVLLKRKPFREYWSKSGLQILVGRRNIDNETLTFTIAHGSDYWLHAADFPGSHVIIKNRKNQQPDEESVADAMQLALFYSRAKDAGEAEVIITQCKYLSRLKGGAPGQVQLSKHQRKYAKLSNQLIQDIKLRKGQRSSFNR